MATSTSTWAPRVSDVYGSLYNTPTPTSTSASSETSTPSTKHKQKDDLYQYYFAFLALLIIIALIMSALIYRHKRRLAHRIRASRQNALSRDLEDANIGRGWTYGDWRLREAMSMTPWRRREEDGLNEAGEAPPPYKPAPDADDAAVLATGRPVSAQNDTYEPAVPPRTLDREQAGLKPPEYTETVARPLEYDPAGSGPSTPGIIDAIHAAQDTPLSTATRPSNHGGIEPSVDNPHGTSVRD